MKMLQLRCPNCNAMLDLKDDIGSQCFCNYCGTKILLDEQQDSVVNAKVRIKELEHEKYVVDKAYEDKDKERKAENRPLTVMIIIFVASFLILGIMAAIESYNSRTIPVPYSASDFCKMDYDDAVEILESAGYKNISTVAQTAKGLFKSKDLYQVNSISIDGNKHFRSGKEFSPNAPIIITYNP